MIELRCAHRKFGNLRRPSGDAGLVEMLCSSRWCGHAQGVIVLHTFDTSTGSLVETRAFREPRKE